MPDQAPWVQTLVLSEPGVETPGQDQSWVLGRCPYDGEIIGASYTPRAAMSGAEVNTRAVRIRNRGQDGQGSTIVAQLVLVAGLNVGAFDEAPMAINSVPANRVVHEGDVLELWSDALGPLGMADPGGLVRVAVQRA